MRCAAPTVPPSSSTFCARFAGLRDHSRRVLEITEVLSYQNGEIQRNPLYRFEELGEDDKGNIIGELRRTENSMQQTEKFRSAGLVCRI